MKIVVLSQDRTQVWNNEQGWVDRDTQPGPTLFPDDAPDRGYNLPMGGEWEDKDV